MLHIAGTAYRGLLRHPSWNLGVVHAPISRFLSDPKPEVEWFRSTGRNKFLADPFAITRDGVTYVFCEEFDYEIYRGKIVCIEIINGTASEPRSAIDLPSHLSYPYLVEYGGKTYCLPESSATYEVGLYEAYEFPLKWRKVASLARNLALVDPTVFQHNGYWWLACGTEDCTRLYLYYASDFLGEWTPHPANPVKESAIRSSRPAGTPFFHDGLLYRPAQDCSTIGRQITLNRVLKLTPEEFEEEEICYIEPYGDGPYSKGIHTLSAVTENMTLVDGSTYRFSPGAFRHYLGVVRHRAL